MASRPAAPSPLHGSVEFATSARALEICGLAREFVSHARLADMELVLPVWRAWVASTRLKRSNGQSVALTADETADAMSVLRDGLLGLSSMLCESGVPRAMPETPTESAERDSGAPVLDRKNVGRSGSQRSGRSADRRRRASAKSKTA